VTIGGRRGQASTGPGSATTRIDAHHHLWDLESGIYSWPTVEEAEIHRTFSAEDLAPELDAAGIDSTVIVQADDSLADTDAMLAAGSSNAWIVGVVGWLPLADRTTAERELESRRDGLCGVRHLIHWEADPDWLVRPDVQPGLELLAEQGLPFDVVAVFPDHVALVPTVARRHPDLALVIDHLAKPPFRRDGWDGWVTGIRAAAEFPSVRAKVSGLDTAAGVGWTVDELRPAWEVALEAFGPDRMMFGSDWPVCRLVSTYGEVVSAMHALIAELSPSEQDRILGGTAVDVYGLRVDGPSTPPVLPG
jgi:L-fuconolactonase